MLNYHVPASGLDQARTEYSNYLASWRCRFGHQNCVYLLVMDTGPIGGSGWDYCYECSEGPPSPRDRLRMSLSIFRQWLKVELVTSEQYQELCRQVIARAEQAESSQETR